MNALKPPSRTALALAFSLLLSAMPACTRKSDEDANLMVYHGQLKDDVKTWDPVNAYDSVSLDVVPSVLETLYQYAYLADTYRVVPLLAADTPKVSADKLTYTIPLKRGVKYQDDACFEGGKGREMKAQDFVLGWKRHALPSLQSQGWWVFDGKLAGINAFHDKLVATPKGQLPRVFDETPLEGVRALDDYTLQIKLVKPYPQLMWILAMPFTSPVPREAVATYADERGNLTDHPVGTGPFTLKQWDRGRRIVLDRNPNFHPDFYPTDGGLEFRKQGLLSDAGKPLPFVDRLSLDIMRESQPRWLGFLNGNLDHLEVPKDNFGQAVSDKADISPELAAKGMRLNIETGVVFRYISFNTQDKLFGNKFLRQALASAIDRDRWIATFTNDTGRKMTTALPPGIPDRPQKSKLKYDFDLERAKELMRKAGYPDGKGLPVVNFDLRGADTVSRQLGDFLTRQWAAIGVKINVVANTFPAYLEKMKQGQLQVSYGGWSMDYPDGENVFQLVYGPNKSPGPNDSNYENKEVDALYEKIASMEPGAVRAALVRRLDDIIQEDCPWAYGYYEASYVLTQPWLLNYRVAEMINNKYKYLRVNKEIRKQITGK